jgi:hypothetical protein
MKRSEAEKAIRRLVHDWAETIGIEPGSAKQPSFLAFKSWLRDRGYSHYLDFRSTAGADYDAELWFDQELKQTWRN